MVKFRMQDNLRDYVYNYPTKYKKGFVKDDLEKLLSEFPKVDMDKFNDAMICNTALIIDNEIVSYHIDIYYALLAGIGKDELNVNVKDHE